MNAQKDSVWYQLYMNRQAGREAAAVPALETVEIRLGRHHLPSADRSQPGGGGLLARIGELRARLAETMGFALPPVHICDDHTLRPDAYAITVRGVEVAAGALDPAELLVLADREGAGPGEPRIDPVFGLPCTCISREDATDALLAGHQVSDSETLIVTHLHEALCGQLARLFGHDALETRLKALAERAPALSAAARDLPPAALVRVYRGLLAEGVSVRDDVTLLEAVLDAALDTDAPERWIEAARTALALYFGATLTGYDGQIHVATFHPETERFLEDQLCLIDGDDDLNLPSAQVEQLLELLYDASQTQRDAGWQPVLLVGPQLRRALSGLALRYLPMLTVLSRREIPLGARLADDAQLSLAAPVRAPERVLH